MPRGRGNNRGFSPGPSPRGRGRGRGKGFRGAFHGRTGGPGEGEGTLVFEGNFEDFTLNHIMPPRPSRGASPSRGRGYQTPPRGFQTPPHGLQPNGARGARTMRGIGFDRSNKTGLSQRSYISLSVLERDRPLLRPVAFVRGESQKTLFQEVEEILHAPGEEGGAIENYAPSADVVERLFKINEQAEGEGTSTDVRKESTSTTNSDTYAQPFVPVTVPPEETSPTFVIDTTPSAIVLGSHFQKLSVNSSTVGSTPLGESVAEEEEEVIVYVAPHPRTDRSAPAIPSPSIAAPKPLALFPEISMLPTQSKVSDSQLAVAATIDDTPLVLSPPTGGHQSRSFQAHARTRFGLKQTPRSRKIAKKERAAARRRAEREAMFDSAGLGLGVDELKSLHHATVDPREAERRRGDSDVDWGTDEDNGIEEVRSVLGDMELDPELPDIAQFARFARGVHGLGAGEMVTIADLEDTARMEEEDNEEATDEDTSDQDGVLDAEERGEDGEGSDLASSESSDEDSPTRGFRARLDRMREKAKGRAVADVELSSGGEDTDDDDDGAFGVGFSWADKDEHFLERLEVMFDENDDILRGQNRSTRNKLIRAIQNGEFADHNLNMRKKDRVIPSHLRDQWDRDRAKKAERKRQRELARIEGTAEYAMRKSMGKKKEKIFGAARFEGDNLTASRTSDMATLEQQIRAFLHNLEVKTMVLPPKSKEWRKRAHLLAEAFNLKSKSKGKGEGRFTTLIKTTRSGVGVNERKISRLVNGNKGEGFQTPTGSGKPILRRNRDGDEVGKMAPKLSESNVGFKLLQQMGWEEGDRIGGATGGLVDPLTAIIKTTKLGLGATR